MTDAAAVADADAGQALPGVLATMRRLLNRPVVAILAVGLIAGALRFAHLGYPKDRIFDELYYSKSACIYLGYSNRRCDITTPDEKYWRTDKNDTGAWVHPPLGKWAIALGELAFGTESFGWRVSAAVFGTATVMVLAGIVQLLFGSPIWTFAGGLLLATESLEFVQSRVAMLDIFVTFWIALGSLLLLLDRRWIERRTPPPAGTDPDATAGTDPGAGAPAGASVTGSPATEARSTRRVPSPFFRPWRIASGVAFGAAFATKWSGITGVAGALALSFLWEVVRRHRAGVRHPLWNALQWESFPLVVFFLAVPAVVYVASYLGWFLHFGFHWRDWMRLQGDMASYHEHLKSVNAEGKPIHPYLAQAWKWILLWRPVLYFARYGEDVRHVIYANGNPAIFWGSILAVPYAAFAWGRKRDWRAGFAVLTVAALYLPWFLVSRPQFFFYATPITPFFVLACVYGLRDMADAHIAGSRSRPWLPVAVGLVVLSVILFVWFWPVLTGGPVSNSAFRLRAWFPSWV
ncbi:MAG TPA: phospholipid carrier-dependent glycosyltransferase [Actinomycetota bacterium]